jgi:GAF domain-containing protein
MERLRSDAQYFDFLLAAGELLSSSLDYRATLRGICETAVHSIADVCVLTVGNVNDVEVVGAAERVGSRNVQLRGIQAHLAPEPGRPAHPLSRVLDSGQTLFVPQIDPAWIDEHASNAEHAAFMRRLRFRSMIVVPVRSLVWGISGALMLVRTERSGRAFDQNAIAFAEDLGRRCGIAIGKARLYSQTRDIAERLQRAALPNTLPDVRGARFDAYYESADAAMLVGGDWYDAFLLRNGDVGISIGDVGGHGIESAALMSSIRNAIRMAMVIEPALPEVLRHADFLFRNEAPEGIICTALVAVLEPATGSVRFASAGHPGPILWDGNAVVLPPELPGVPLGSGEIGQIDGGEHAFRLAPGQMAVFYTDGLIEWNHRPVDGEAALCAALANPAVRLHETPALALRHATVAGPHSDDIAVLTLQLESEVSTTS